MLDIYFHLLLSTIYINVIIFLLSSSYSGNRKEVKLWKILFLLYSLSEQV